MLLSSLTRFEGRSASLVPVVRGDLWRFAVRPDKDNVPAVGRTVALCGCVGSRAGVATASDGAAAADTKGGAVRRFCLSIPGGGATGEGLDRTASLPLLPVAATTPLAQTAVGCVVALRCRSRAAALHAATSCWYMPCQGDQGFKKSNIGLPVFRVLCERSAKLSKHEEGHNHNDNNAQPKPEKLKAK